MDTIQSFTLSFLLANSGPITESSHMAQSQNSGPITESNHVDQSQDPSFSNTAAMCKTVSYFTPCCSVNFLHLSVCGSSPHQKSQTRFITQAVLHVSAQACRHAMTADHACHHRTQVNLLASDATHNRVSVSLAYNQFTVFFLPQSCTLLSSLQSTTR